MPIFDLDGNEIELPDGWRLAPDYVLGDKTALNALCKETYAQELFWETERDRLPGGSPGAQSAKENYDFWRLARIALSRQLQLSEEELDA